MRERAREVRGELRIQSQPGKGTEVIVIAPLPLVPTESLSETPAAPAPALSLRSPAV